MPSDVQVLPERFLERLQSILSPRDADAALRTFAQPKPTTFRVNTLKASVPEVRQPLEAEGFRLEAVPWYPEAFVLREGRLRQLQATTLYQTGMIYVQSLSSMLPPLVLDPRPGEEVLDLTAAPGSKTTQLACLMRGRGRVVANDSHRVRFFKLRANVALQAAHNVHLMLCDGIALGRTSPERFDRVLLDAPCSAEGRFNVHEPSSYRYWKPAKVHEMVRKQKPLLASAIAALRPGGVLVYSTCTFAPEENEGVVDWALKKFGASVSVEAIRLPVTNALAGLGAWEGKSFDPSVRRTVRVLPTASMEGFFLAKLRKLSPGPGSADVRGQAPFEENQRKWCLTPVLGA
jgi:16S rRNA (cytosine1407-C5)-methyltransferase